jgi:hypothetical protein
MSSKAGVYEERRVLLRRHGFDGYRRHVLEEVAPRLEEAGGQLLCLLNGLVGAPPEEAYVFAGFEGLDAWRRLRVAWRRPAGADLVSAEHSRLLEPSVRPKWPVPPEDRRAVYGLRRFLIRAVDWGDFVRYSRLLWEAGDWENATGACILGLFREASEADPLPVVLLSGYRSASHWDETRPFFRGRLDTAAEGQEQEVLHAYRMRNDVLPLTAHVCLMRAHWPDG